MVIIVPLLLITAFFTRNLGDHPVNEVDWRPVATLARSQAPYAVLAPVNLPEGWRAVQATWVRTGEPYLNGDAVPAQPVEARLPQPATTCSSGSARATSGPTTFVRDETRDGDGRRPERRGRPDVGAPDQPDGRTRSLVESTPQVTTIVSADLPYGALETYAGILSGRRLSASSVAPAD